jgi:glutamyl-tRNA synthetase
MARIVRFAPSPTGYIHLGNARTALLNWCIGKACDQNGTFILRFDDTDAKRSRDEFADAIAKDLEWLGIRPDVIIRQSDRLERYAEVAEELKKSGRLYACYETADELERRRKRQLGRGLPPIYDRAALKLDYGDRKRLEAEGLRPHWRFLLEHRPVVWIDGVRGVTQVDAGSVSDPILIREDGTPLYTFTSVVDDVDFNVTFIMRGEDHVTNTSIQVQLFETLGAKTPVFAHHNLLTTTSGEGLSKRLGHFSIRSLREDGFEAIAVATLAVLTGTSEAVRPVGNLQELCALVSLDRISRAPARFDDDELAALNARVLHQADYEEVRTSLVALGVGGGEEFWNVVRPNCEKLRDARYWWDITNCDVFQHSFVDSDKRYLEEALRLIPDEPWSPLTWKEWTTELAARTKRKGRALFMPLRAALTGQEAGPELAGLLPFIGRGRCLTRLNASIRQFD